MRPSKYLITLLNTELTRSFKHVIQSVSVEKALN